MATMRNIIENFNGVKETEDGVVFNQISLDLIRALRENCKENRIVDLVIFTFYLNTDNEKQYCMNKKGEIKEEYQTKKTTYKELKELIEDSKSNLTSVYFRD